MEITNEILFEEHAAVFEHAAHEIASSMNINLDAAELISGANRGYSCPHILKFRVGKSTSATIITADEVANIPVWPPEISTIQKIKTALTFI